ncbi:MAG: DUF3649 domain-containing protein [Sphingomonadales bacterium]|nr:DUF3649 domain-containing protein [Sphingomonadales bacterium]
MAASRADRRGWRYRGNVAARVLAATFGAYGVAACLAMAVARSGGGGRIDAVIAGTLCAYLAVPAVAIWAFLARGPWRAWGGVVVLAAVFGGLAWMIGPPAR